MAISNQPENLDEKLKSFAFPMAISIMAVLLTIIGWFIMQGIKNISEEVAEIRKSQIEMQKLGNENATNIKLIQLDMKYQQLDTALLKKQLEELKKSLEEGF